VKLVFEFAPVGADVSLPAEGMETADQCSATGTIVAIGDAVIVLAAVAGFGARGANVGKAKLRSQYMLFALLSVPAIVSSFSKEVVSLAEGILSDVHDGGGG
jgi:hypothetical protein